jgi:hypothetical protein
VQLAGEREAAAGLGAVLLRCHHASAHLDAPRHRFATQPDGPQLGHLGQISRSVRAGHYVRPAPVGRYVQVVQVDRFQHAPIGRYVQVVQVAQYRRYPQAALPAQVGNSVRRELLVLPGSARSWRLQRAQQLTSVEERRKMA